MAEHSPSDRTPPRCSTHARSWRVVAGGASSSPVTRKMQPLLLHWNDRDRMDFMPDAYSQNTDWRQQGVAWHVVGLDCEIAAIVWFTYSHLKQKTRAQLRWPSPGPINLRDR